MDVEKYRSFLPQLVPLCDMFFTNQEFPESYFSSRMKVSFPMRLDKKSEESSIKLSGVHDADDKGFMRALIAMTFLFDEAPSDESTTTGGRSRAELVVTTRGALGSLLMRRKTVAVLHDEVENGSPIKRQKCESTTDVNFIDPDVLEKTPIEIEEFVLTRQCPTSKVEEVFSIVR